MKSILPSSRIVILMMAGLLMMGMVGTAKATPVTLSFSGSVATGYDSSNLFGGGNLTGDSFTATISFDTASIGTSSCGASTSTTSCNWSTNGNSSFTQTLTMMAGGQSYTQLFTGSTTNSLSLGSSGNDAIYLSFGGSGYSVSLNAVDLTKSGFFANDANVNDLNLSFSGVAVNTGSSAEYGNMASTSFTLNFASLTASSGSGSGGGSGGSGSSGTNVPEPSAFLIFAAALAGFAVLRPRRNLVRRVKALSR